MRKFAADLGIDFEPAWALMFPLEKILAYVDEDAQDFPLTEEDHQLIDQLGASAEENARDCTKAP